MSTYVDPLDPILNVKQKWLVLWHNGGRVGSVELSDDNLRHFQSQFCMSLIQRDASGTEHWNVLAKTPIPKSRIRKEISQCV